MKKLKTLDGMEYSWKKGKEKGQGSISSLHKHVRDILQEEFPILSYMEEVPILVKRRKTLYFDFYIPLFNLAIEVHGEQPYQFSSFFHKTIDRFIEYRKNDFLKIEFCEHNDISILELKYDDREQWRNTIVSKIKKT